MNYIRHLNAFFSFVRKEERLACSHVSLYLALFQYWNYNRFQNPFPVYRDNLLKLSKIGSKNTYHKCIKELHLAGYIIHHPPTSQFQPVKISMIRLDVTPAANKTYKQLDLFQTASLQSGPGEPTRPIFGTVSVPDMTGTSPTIDTAPVPKLGHTIKHKLFKNEYKHPSQDFSSTNQEQKKSAYPAVPNMGLQPHPTMVDVQQFFKASNYPDQEALKFFHHYESTDWKIKGITPITDWHASANKWMINTRSFGGTLSSLESTPPSDSISNLFKRLKAGQNIFRHLKPEHFRELSLELTKEHFSLAVKERINQLTGSNQHATLQLLQAYITNKPGDPLISKDQTNLQTIAMQIATLQKLQEEFG